MEMDSRVVFNTLTFDTNANFPFGMFIDDCQALANSMEHVCFSLVRRSANSVVHNQG